jgi:hypothetical protein
MTLGSLAAAQDLSPDQRLNVAPDRTPGAIKDAGVYHMVTGTWTRTGSSSASFGPDVIYNNTAESGYFTSVGMRGGFAAGGRVYDSGGIPGESNGSAFPVAPDRECYRVDAFEIGYCDFGSPGTSGWTFNFLDTFNVCNNTYPTPQVAEITATGLPAGGGCWTVTIDLTGGMEFSMSADGDPVPGGWDDDIVVDTFGFGIRYAGSEPASTEPAGWLISGDPNATDPRYLMAPFGSGDEITDGTGTYFGPASLCGGEGTGFLTEDRYWLEDIAGNGVNTRCGFFGGYRNIFGCGPGFVRPYASIHMKIHASDDPCPSEAFSPYCATNPNRTDLKSQLSIEGSPVASLDDVTLVATTVTSNSTGFFLTSQTPGFVAQPAGSQGNLCLGGAIGRFVGPGQVMTTRFDQTVRLSTTAGQWSNQAIPTPTGNYAASAGTTSYFQFWHRDTLFGQPTSNFTNGVAVTWE